MTLAEAKQHIGNRVEAEYTDRRGNVLTGFGELLDVEFVPMYGSSLVFDFGEVSLDRMVAMRDSPLDKAA
ncbi:MAG: hypothetical protein IH851_00335 [Armatimonadetes bacterium]|nr:hypothetical protein [Armatimonadota bacterium]